MRPYEESIERLLDMTRRQYERQIELLQERLEHQGEGDADMCDALGVR